MVRYSMALVAVLALTAAVQADNIRGVVKSVDSNKTITLNTGNNQEQTLELAQDVRVYGVFTQGRRGRRGTTLMQMSNGLNAVQQNQQVLVTTVNRDGQEVVTQIRIENMTFNNGGGRRGILRR